MLDSPFHTLLLVFAGLTALIQPTTPSLTRLTLMQRGEQHLAVQAFDRGDDATALPIFTRLAALGDARSETDLARMYDQGLGVPQDVDKAFALQIQAAAQHYGKAENNLGWMYRSRGDDISATHWFWLSAQHGDPDGQAAIAGLYNCGCAVLPRDETASVHWFRLSAAQGNADGEYGLGQDYDYGAGVKQDFGHAIRLYRAAAGQGNTQAMCAIGTMYEYGNGRTRDYGAAMGWYRKAAWNGDDCGDVGVGFMYDLGLGVPSDETTALKWYAVAAQDGDATGENDVGAMYHRGAGGVAQDFAKAAYWFGLAADQGSAYGEMNLATLYINGQGVPHNDVRGFMLDQSAAAQSEPHAEEQLGNAYRLGYATKIDYGQAAKFYTRAAQHGLPQSQAALAYLFETGQGLPRDYAAAYKWYLISQVVTAHPIIENDERCQEFAALAVPDLADIQAHLTPAQAAQAHADATAWLALHRPLQDSARPARAPVLLWPFVAAGTLIAALLASLLMRRRAATFKEPPEA